MRPLVRQFDFFDKDDSGVLSIAEMTELIKVVPAWMGKSAT